MNYMISERIISSSVLILLFLLILRCKSLVKHGPLPGKTEYEYVEACEKKWIYTVLSDTTTIRLLTQNEKGGFDCSNWPNLFIGITNKNDTVRLVDDFTKKKSKKMLY